MEYTGLGATGLLALGRLTRHAGVRGARQHAVFGSHPTLALAAQEGRYAFFDAGSAQHTCVAKLDEYRAFGVAGEVAGDAHVAQLIGSTAAGSHRKEILERCERAVAQKA